jgi:DNA-directed RNA polymerase subunit RPC12/RpoP
MDDTGFLVAVGVTAIICGLIGRTIGERKGRAEAGFIFGALLGPIGILIIAVGPDVKAEQAALRAKKCPACKGSVPDDARKCMHCGEDLAVQLAPAPVQVPKPPKSPTPKELADGSHIPCPHCGQRLRVSTLKQGENWCVCCFEKFIVE